MEILKCSAKNPQFLWFNTLNVGDALTKIPRSLQCLGL